MKYIFNNQKGAVIVMFALLLVALVGFTSLAVEVGRWYLVRAELSKAVDAAVLTAAQNISNPSLPGDKLNTLAQDFGLENFPVGYLGTPGEGEKAVTFVVEPVGTYAFQVTGKVSVFPIFSALFGIETVVTGSSGVAQKNAVEIMMVLDRSGSMWGALPGSPMYDLKSGAQSFVDSFEETQADDKMGLISFGTGVTVDHALRTNFFDEMSSQIKNINVGRTSSDVTTNAEDAIDRSDNPGVGFTDQTGVPGDLRVRQFLIFFTDGQANTFRGKFTRDGIDYDAAASIETVLYNPTIERYGKLYDPKTGEILSSVLPLPTGDGKEPNATSCSSCMSCHNTKWHVFSEYPVPGHGAEECGIPRSALPYSWFSNTATQKAIKHAQELKDKGIHIYVIGLGYVVETETFLQQIASEPASEYYYYTPNSDKLKAIFNTIAQKIKLRLVR